LILSRDKQKAFFFDRDGVINVDRGYVSTVEDFEFTDGIFDAMHMLADKGFLLLVVTNQSGIGRGYYTQEDFRRVTGWMLEQFAQQGIRIAGVYSCPHSPEADCDCRKPAPGMLQQAVREHNIDPAASWLIGDKPSDMDAAAAAGIQNRVLIGGADYGQPVHRISTLRELRDLPI
jgi:D-glycero-D-manno-heptose 1,7-bisphosphate phosphatase